MRNGRNGSLRVTSARRRWWPPGLPGQLRTMMIRIAAALAILLVIAGLAIAASALHSRSNQSEAKQTAGSIAAPRPNAVPAVVAKTGQKGQAGESRQAGKASKAPVGTRLVLVGPLSVVDTRDSRRLAANADVPLPLPKLPKGSTAILAEVSVLDATGAGAVTLTSAAGEITALRVPAAGAQLTTTAIVRIGSDARLRARVEGGGHLVVNLIGAFQPAETSDSGRVVATSAATALELVPAIDGHDAVIDVDRIPALAKAGGLSAVLVQVSADVGRHGGFIQVGPDPKHFTQEFYWSATSGSDRVRDGFLVVPVTDGEFAVHYKAGLRLRVEVVGYVTDGTAPDATAGLVVPVAPDSLKPVTVGAGTTAQVSIAGKNAQVPADRIAAAVLNVATEAEKGGGMNVFAPGTDEKASAALQVSPDRPRSLVTLVGARGGAVQIAAETRSIVTLTPQALILSR